jgi:hypothetical protein
MPTIHSGASLVAVKVENQGADDLDFDAPVMRQFSSRQVSGSRQISGLSSRQMSGLASPVSPMSRQLSSQYHKGSLHTFYDDEADAEQSECTGPQMDVIPQMSTGSIDSNHHRGSLTTFYDNEADAVKSTCGSNHNSGSGRRVDVMPQMRAGSIGSNHHRGSLNTLYDNEADAPQVMQSHRYVSMMMP